MRPSWLCHAPHVSHVVLVVSFCALVMPSVSAQQKGPGRTQQQAKVNIAVLDFDPRAGISKEEAITLSDILQANIVDTEEFIVVDRQRIKKILEEQGFQQSEACSQVECIVETGRILNVQKMIAGTIGKIGTIYSVNVQVIDVATAQIQVNKSKQLSGSLDDVVNEVMPEISNEVATALLGRPPRRLASAGGGSGWFWWTAGTAVVLGGGAAAYLLLSKKDVVEEPKPLPLPSWPSP